MVHRSYNKLLKRLQALAALPSVEMETLGQVELAGRTYPLILMHLGQPAPGRLGVTISAGIHGDEPAGVEAAVRFIEKTAGNESFLSCFHFIVFPCDNPSGWERNTRENADGLDLNRQFATAHPAQEAALIMGALERRCFDLVFEMHEDVDAPGFYLYELADDPANRVGEAIVRAVARSGYPIHPGREIEGLPAAGGIIRPTRIRRFRKTHLPKAVYTYRTCGGHVITLEPPASVLSFEDRVKIELTGLAVALEAAAARR